MLIKNISVFFILFFCIFFLGSWLREANMLSTGPDVSAPPFELQSLAGIPVSSDSLRGKKTLIYFFAPWCPICRISMPNLEDFHHEKGREVNVVAIALDYESHEELLAFKEEYALTFPILEGTKVTQEAYRIQGYPSYYILDENGMVTHKSMGYSTEIGMVLRSQNWSL